MQLIQDPSLPKKPSFEDPSLARSASGRPHAGPTSQAQEPILDARRVKNAKAKARAIWMRELQGESGLLYGLNPVVD